MKKVLRNNLKQVWNTTKTYEKRITKKIIHKDYLKNIVEYVLENDI